MTREALIRAIHEKGSFLCVGLDTDPDRIPRHFHGEAEPVLAFNKRIIDATADLCVAYKVNVAFYQYEGGWETLRKTLAYIPAGIFTIADAKVGDIGNTAEQYAEGYFGRLGFDAVTIAPYMGHDAIQPFLKREGKWGILLGLTSNEGAGDLQELSVGTSEGRLFERVLELGGSLGSPDDLIFVVGATRADRLRKVRAIVPEHFLLIPGIGAQGGDLERVMDEGLTKDIGLLVNVSRSIIYAGEGSDDPGREARERAREIRDQMAPRIP